MDLEEQRRINRLVERVGTLRANVLLATIDSRNRNNCRPWCTENQCNCSCAICGERFSLIRRDKNVCKICKRYICQKCGIDGVVYVRGTNAGNNETLRNTFLKFVQERIRIFQIFHRQNEQPEVDGQNGASSQNGQDRLNGHDGQCEHRQQKENEFFCKICAETKEVWKKTGAWFYHGLPVHI